MIVRKPSIGEVILLLVLFVSIVPVADATFGIGQAPALTFICVAAYLWLLGVSFTRGQIYFDQGWMSRLLLFWILVMLARGFEPNYEYLRGLVVSPYIFLPFTLPFIVGLLRISDIRRCIGYVAVMNVAYLIFVMLNYDFLSSRGEGATALLENISHFMGFPNFLLLFYFSRLSKFEKLLSIVVFALGLYLALAFARRGLTWSYAWAGVLAVIVNFLDLRRLLKANLVTVIIMVSTLFAALFIFLKNSQQILAPLIDRLYEDSRGSIIYDFFKDMTVFDMWFGRGIGGSYYLWTTKMMDHSGDYRNIIESGWLNLILYGGYILLVLVGVIYVRAIYNGLFRSKNQLAKAFSAMILLHLIQAYPAGVFFFDLYFLLVWIGVCLCLNRSFIDAGDECLR